MKTDDLCKKLRLDPVLQLLISERTFRSLPYPYIVRNKPLMGFLFYELKLVGQRKMILPPAAAVVVGKETGAVCEFRGKPLCWLGAHDAESELGVYPPPALVGMSLDESYRAYRAYAEHCDKLMDHWAAPRGEQDDAPVALWKEAFNNLVEPGLKPYYEAFAPLPSVGAPRKLTAQDAEDESFETVEPSTAAVESVPSTEALLGAADRLRPFVKAHGDERDFKELARIINSLGRPVYTVATVGEFSRGKSSIVNALLDTELLPTGDVPTTAMLTRISGGTARLVRIRRDGTREVLDHEDLCADSLMVGPDGKDPEGVLALTLPNTWLESSGIQLIDTPGAGDLEGHRAEIAQGAIRGCDAALVVVNATLPLSLTERAFIEEHVLSVKTPQVAVVLTRLDLLSEVERGKVIEFMVNRLADWSPGTPVWGAQRLPLPEENSIAVAGPEEIRDAITRWAEDPERNEKRQIQSCACLRLLGSRLLASIDVTLHAASLDQKERKKQLVETRVALETKGAVWKNLSAGMDQAELHAEKIAQKLMETSRQEILKGLEQRVKRAPDPVQWWEKDLPVELEKAILAIRKKVGGTLQKQLAKDIKWMGQELAASFDESDVPGLPALKAEIEMNADTLINTDFSDLDKQSRMVQYTVLGASLVALLVPGVGLPLKAAVSAAGTFFSNKWRKTKTEACRTEMVGVLDRVVERTLSEATEAMCNELRAVYQDVQMWCRSRGEAWLKKALEALENDGGGEVDTDRMLRNARREVSTILDLL